MSTCLDLVTDALIMTGDLAQGQSPSPEDAQFLFTRLNAILDSLSQDGAYIFTRTITPYALTPNVQNYAIGPTATPPFNTARPTKIDAARILVTLAGNANLSVKDLDIIDYAKYLEISDRTASAQIPEEIYFDNAVPNANVFLFPVPTCLAATQLELTVWSQLPQFASLTSQFVFPPGYYEMLVLVLAIAISPAYNKQVDPVTAGRADTCTKRIKEINQMILRPGLVPVAQGPGGVQPGAAQQQAPPAFQ